MRLALESPRFEDLDPDIADALEYLTSELYRTTADIYDVILNLQDIYDGDDDDDGKSRDAVEDEVGAWYASIGANLDGVSLAFQDPTSEVYISEMGEATIQASTPADDKH